MATGKGRQVPERDASVQHAMQQTRQAGVFDALVSTGARLEDSCWLEPGLGVASWCNRYDQTRYHKPGHHTISVYLQGGEQTERLDGPGGHGGTGKVCIMPDHHRSEWLVREEFRFFHLYFTPAHFTRIAEQVCDKEGRHLVLGFAGGAIGRLPANLALLKNADLLGVDVRHFLATQPERARQVRGSLFRRVRDGVLPLPGMTRFTLAQAADALRATLSRARRGKVVVVPQGGVAEAGRLA